MNISVKIANVTFKNPVTVASGTFGHAQRYYNLEEVKRLGAIVPKTVTYYAQVGNPPVKFPIRLLRVLTSMAMAVKVLTKLTASAPPSWAA